MRLCTVGGYNEVGKNMTSLIVDNEAVIFDIGFYLPKIIDFEEEGGSRKDLTNKALIRLGAIPNDNIISSWKDKVKAILIGHCHLDHLGAVPYLAPKYNAPVMGTPYTIEVLKTMLRDEKLILKNPIKTVSPNSSYKISKNMEAEFINITHSTLQTAMIAIHTKQGTILYANDFKFDNYPIVGKKPNYKRLKELGSENVIALVVDSLYSGTEGKTPSEKVAREMLKDVMLGTENSENAVIATTFASHIARLKSIVDFGLKLNRKIVFLGRSMRKYITAAENINLINFSKRFEVIGFSDKIKKKLKQIEKQGRSNFLIICTGGQGEPGSILMRMVTNQLPFDFLSEDHIIFSNRTIPTPINIANRSKLEDRLRKKNTRVFTDVHSSGHAYREDLRDLIKMTNPQHIIPAHGDIGKLTPLSQLTAEMGYKLGKEVHILSDGQKIDL